MNITVTMTMDMITVIAMAMTVAITITMTVTMTMAMTVIMSMAMFMSKMMVDLVKVHSITCGNWSTRIFNCFLFVFVIIYFSFFIFSKPRNSFFAYFQDSFFVKFTNLSSSLFFKTFKGIFHVKT